MIAMPASLEMPGRVNPVRSLARFSHRCSVLTRLPDSTLPLRLQSAGRALADGRRAHWILWTRNLIRRDTWLQAAQSTWLAILIEFLLCKAAADAHPWLFPTLALLTLLVTAGAIASA